MRILIFVVAYNAEQHLCDTLDRISRDWLSSIDYELLVIDDASQDKTSGVMDGYILTHNHLEITFLRNENNLGYGGNQKKGYQYAIDHNFDVVVLLHGDGQYAPEYLPQMIDPILRDQSDVVLGSRMIHKVQALKGKMPIYKWVGNQVLTKLQNLMLGSNLSEFHTGYRAFRTESLQAIPLKYNSDYYDFDTEIIIQFMDIEARFREISIPTFYGNEVSYVNGLMYAWLIIKATIKSRLVRKGLVSDSRFQYVDDANP